MTHTLFVRIRLMVLLGAIVMSFAVVCAPAASSAADLGTFTLHKTEGEGDTPGTPIEGIQFQLQQLQGISVTDQASLNELSTRDPRVLADGGEYLLAAPIAMTTDAQGIATASGLADGVYLVKELPSRSGDVAYSVIEPFLIAIGYEGKRDIVVWAKNQAVTITLAVSKNPVVEGDVFSVTAQGTVPAPDRDEKLHRYVVVVETDPLFLDPMVGRVWISSALGDVELQEGRDYTATWNSEFRQMMVTLTPHGLSTLAPIRLHAPDTHVNVRLDGRTGTPSCHAGTPGNSSSGDSATLICERLTFMSALFVDGWAVPTTQDKLLSQGILSNPQFVDVIAPNATDEVVDPSMRPGSEPTQLPDILVASGGLFAGGALLTAATLCVLLFFMFTWRRSDEDEEQELVHGMSGSERK